MSAKKVVDRRAFLKVTSFAGAGLALGVFLPSRAVFGAPRPKTAAPEPFAPNAFLRVAADGTVTIAVTRSEMGQGVRTSLPMLVAEELDADWSKVRIEQAGYHEKYGKQDTAGSLSITQSWEPLRKAGAAAREMLVAAAALELGVPADSLRTERGAVVHAASKRRLDYGALAARAATLPVPAEPKLKSPKDFKIVGTAHRRLDTPEKVDGTAKFGFDVAVPGMLVAAVARCPVFGGKLAKLDATKAKAVPGVRQVVEVPSGVAVVADSTWAAIQGRDALDVAWDEGPVAAETDATLAAQLDALVSRDAKEVRNDGDAATAFAGAARTVEAVYETPWLAHATMEPMNCVAHVRGDRADFWVPTQSGAWIVAKVSKEMNIPKENITVTIPLLGTGFGRRIMPDFPMEAAYVSKAAGAPVKVIWTRDDDMQHDFYRPPSRHRMRAALDGAGRVVAWSHRIATPAIMTYFKPDIPNPESSEIGGAVDFAYAVPNFRLEYASATSGVPRGWMRGVEHPNNAFAKECFLDEVAAAAKRDPFELRRELLAERRLVKNPVNEGEADATVDTARLKAVLELAAEKAGWGEPLPKGRARGIAAHPIRGAYVAEVAEVSVGKDGSVRVHRVVAAVDCGVVVSPDGLRQVVEGGVVFGLSMALRGEITIDRGRVTQSSFLDYPVLRMHEAPKVEVYVVPSAEAPGGAGEVAVPAAVAAVANAVFAATGRPVRKLPIRL